MANNDEFETRWRNSIDRKFEDQNVALSQIRERLEETCDSLSVIRQIAVTTAKFDEFKEGVRAALETERDARRARIERLEKDIERAQTAVSVLRWVGGIVFAVVVALLKFWP